MLFPSHYLTPLSLLFLSYSLTHSHTPDGRGIRHDSRSLFQIHRLLYVLILISTNVPSNVADPARPIQFSPTEAFQVLAGLCHTGEEKKEKTHTHTRQWQLLPRHTLRIRIMLFRQSSCKFYIANTSKKFPAVRYSRANNFSSR